MFVIGSLINVFDKSFSCSIEKPKYYFKCKSLNDINNITYDIKIIEDDNVKYEFDDETCSMKFNPPNKDEEENNEKNNEENKNNIDVSNIIFNPNDIKYLIIDKNFEELDYEKDDEEDEDDDEEHKTYIDNIDILEKIKSFKNVEYIFINRIENINLSKLCYFNNLKTLCLENVNYSSLPININPLNLSLSNCKYLKEIPKEYSNLQLIDLYGFIVIKEIPETFINLKTLNLFVHNNPNINIPDTLINLEEINFIKDEHLLKDTFIKMINCIKPTFNKLKIINSFLCECDSNDFKQNINILYPINNISNNCIINIYNCENKSSYINECNKLYSDINKNIYFYHIDLYKNILLNETANCIIC